MGETESRMPYPVSSDESERVAQSGRCPAMCPIIEEPFPECHCSEMTSVKISDAIYYCQEHYLECPIFRNRTIELGSRSKSIHRLIDI